MHRANDYYSNAAGSYCPRAVGDGAGHGHPWPCLWGRGLDDPPPSAPLPQQWRLVATSEPGRCRGRAEAVYSIQSLVIVRSPFE